MEWTAAGAGTLTEITSGDGVININDPNGPIPSLTVNVGPFLKKTGGSLDLNVPIPLVNDYVLSSDTAGVLSWVAQTGGGGGTGTVTSVTATADQYCTIGGVSTVNPTVGLNVTAAGTNGQVLSATANAGELAFITPTAGTVTNVQENGPYITITQNTTAPKVSLSVGVPANDNDILSSTKAGVLSWVTPAAGTIYTGTAPIDITGPAVSLKLSNYFEGNGAGALDFKVTAAPVNNQILSTTGGALTWINQQPTISATLPVALNAGVISLPISGDWSATNNVVKSSNGGNLEWGSDTAGSGTVTNVTAAYPLSVATSTTTPAITLGLSNSFENDSSNNLALKTTIAPVDGYILSAVGTDGVLNWIAPPNTGVQNVTATADQYCVIGGTATAPTVGLNVTNAGTSGQVLSATANAGQLAFVNPPTAIATQIVNITTLPVWTIGCQPSGTITYSSYAGYSTTTLGNMSTYNGLSGVYLSCTADCPVGVSITMNTANFQLQPPIYASIPSQNQPYFNGILYNMTTGYNLFGFWQIRSDTSAYWQTNNNEAALNPPVTGDLLYLDILPFVYVNA